MKAALLHELNKSLLIEAGLSARVVPTADRPLLLPEYSYPGSIRCMTRLR